MISIVFRSTYLDKAFHQLLDQELERRGVSYVRYADDLLIFTGSTKSATRVYSGVVKYITERMRLVVNADKSGIRRLHEVTFLGHSLDIKHAWRTKRGSHCSQRLPK
ncbi:MAG: hypothetical protein KA341_07140 [Saprospiraceae bacterium]|nr:hypothetical protein [Saprospiraceae bacterium]